MLLRSTWLALLIIPCSACAHAVKPPAPVPSTLGQQPAEAPPVENTVEPRDADPSEPARLRLAWSTRANGIRHVGRAHSIGNDAVGGFPSGSSGAGGGAGGSTSGSLAGPGRGSAPAGLGSRLAAGCTAGTGSGGGRAAGRCGADAGGSRVGSITGSTGGGGISRAGSTAEGSAGFVTSAAGGGTVGTAAGAVGVAAGATGCSDARCASSERL
jgi:hypothetical protein